MAITIYSTHTCGFCNMLKNYLDSKDIKYDVKYADDNPKYAEELFEKSGQMGVPFTIIDDGDNQTKILGFDKPKFDKVLDIK